MPFVPLTPKERERFKPPCSDRQHNPPSMIAIREAMKWRCPACGHETIVDPADPRLTTQPRMVLMP